MALSLFEAKKQLLSGEVLSWPKFGENKAGSTQLSTPAARRLFQYLLTCDQVKVAEGSESLFDGLVSAWENIDLDPAADKTLSGPVSTTGPWRLARIESSGFGGLNMIGGPNLDIPFDGQNWCLEGQNGSGKTSLVSAIIWALTGYRCRDQDGLVFERGHRGPVYDDSGARIGDWPAIVAYPSNSVQLSGPAATWVRLTFQDPEGNSTHAYRKLISAPNEEPMIEVEISSDLLVSPHLFEVGLLMPARLSRIGFGEKSQTIYEAVKLLTGLDQIAAIAEGASSITHKAKRFLKYSVDKGAPALETKIALLLDRASEEAKKAEFELKIAGNRRDKNYSQELRNIAQRGSEQAATHLGVLTSDITDTIDINEGADRAAIRQAVSIARGILQDSSKGVSIFDAWKAMWSAYDDAGFQTIPNLISHTRQKLAEAISWDERQSKDYKLRLKALASQFFEPSTHEHNEADCPLCESKLSGEKRQALANEWPAPLKVVLYEVWLLSR
ncbi:AAA family ATPase (plasmid) [Phyllobacterium sp. 628]|uniref:AAA family ATPase n=1 Tax=Phyllobacterium sp. 628 TaxID=2718938 RepID=UPI0016626F71|nr:AAA family ATPase [Phyllobacterium sp. 628]QND54576.1 AAA family ATPase [Phyllobacterium sp. 628]